MSEAMKTAIPYNSQEMYNRSLMRSMKNRARRERQLRRRIVTFVVMSSVIIFIALFLSFSFLSDAKDTSNHKEYRYYSSVTVKAGDSVWSIAESNLDRMHYNNVESYVRDIASVNKISADSKLTAGTSLIIPYYSDEWK